MEGDLLDPLVMGALCGASLKGGSRDLEGVLNGVCLSLKNLLLRKALEGWLRVLRSSDNFREQEGSQNKVGQRQELEVLGKVYS